MAHCKRSGQGVRGARTAAESGLKKECAPLAATGDFVGYGDLVGV